MAERRPGRAAMRLLLGFAWSVQNSVMAPRSSILRACVPAIFLVTAWCLAAAAFANDVFVATMRAPAGATQAGGHLYRVDLESRTSTLVGRILVDGTQPVGLTGMAFHPRTNVLYGITLGINDAKRAALLTIDPVTAEARVVGRLSRPLSDISFDPDGRLFGWTANTGQLAIVDINTARVATVGETAAPAAGGAFAIDSRGNGYVARWGSRGTLDQVDLQQGTIEAGPAVSNLADVSTLRSMAFSAANELLATVSVRSTAAGSALLRIDPATGEARAVGDIPDDSEAIAVAATRPMARSNVMRWIAYAVLAVTLLVLTGLHVTSHRASRR